MKLEEKLAVEQAVRSLLKALSVDVDDPNFKETPDRVSRMFLHFFRGNTKDEVKKLMTKVFPSNNDQMVIVKDIECFGMCPHHLVPIVYKVDIGYIPKGKVLGLSKLARLAIILASYPKLQEDYTKEIADVLVKYLKPVGVMVVIRGMHGCMRFRGVEMEAETITSDCRGAFRKDNSTRMEFFELMKTGKVE